MSFLDRFLSTGLLVGIASITTGYIYYRKQKLRNLKNAAVILINTPKYQVRDKLEELKKDSYHYNGADLSYSVYCLVLYHHPKLINMIDDHTILTEELILMTLKGIVEKGNNGSAVKCVIENIPPSMLESRTFVEKLIKENSKGFKYLPANVIDQSHFNLALELHKTNYIDTLGSLEKKYSKDILSLGLYAQENLHNIEIPKKLSERIKYNKIFDELQSNFFCNIDLDRSNLTETGSNNLWDSLIKQYADIPNDHKTWEMELKYKEMLQLRKG
jgi:hypothetical protein